MVPVSLRQISKSYDGTTQVLSDISLEMEAGEFFFLLGPSGCGKTTLLRMIAGFLEPTDGSIFFGEKEVTRLSAERRDTAMVFQSYALWPHMTVAENVGFGLDVRGVKGGDKDTRVKEALATVGLGDLADRRIPALSGGQQQRVALARAIVVRPQVLLLDEPLSNLDAKLRVMMRGELRRICKEAGLTAIYVTHDQKEALSMADRIAVMHEGILQQVGTPREVYSHPRNKFVADFIGESNFIDVQVQHVEAGQATIRSPLGDFTSSNLAEGLEAGAKALLCIRPESVHILDAPPNGQANAFTGELSDYTYLGEIAQCHMQAAGLDLGLFEIHPKPRELGAQLHCRIDPEDLIVLHAEG